jgi:hypothetical protein
VTEDLGWVVNGLLALYLRTPILQGHGEELEHDIEVTDIHRPCGSMLIETMIVE